MRGRAAGGRKRFLTRFPLLLANPGPLTLSSEIRASPQLAIVNAKREKNNTKHMTAAARYETQGRAAEFTFTAVLLQVEMISCHHLPILFIHI